MSITDATITELPTTLPYDELFALCMRIRMNEVLSTPDVRARAKAITFAAVYGNRPNKFGER